MEITKLDAARRQLNVAIRLWLDEGDLCAVQTLAWAALTILADLDKAGNCGSGFARLHRKRDWFFDGQLANFLKHADRDPTATTYEIEATTQQWTILAAVYIYRELTGSESQEMNAAFQVLDLKFGISEGYLKREQRRRNEMEESMRRMDDMTLEEQEEYLDFSRRQDAARQRAILSIGRQLLDGEPLFS